MNSQNKAATMWKVQFRHSIEYFEADQYDRLVAHLTDEAILAEYRADGAGSEWQRRRRLNSWLTRRTGKDEDVKGMRMQRVRRPEVHALVDGDWVEVDWALVEPTVDISIPLNSGSSGELADEDRETRESIVTNAVAWVLHKGYDDGDDHTHRTALASQDEVELAREVARRVLRHLDTPQKSGG